MKYNHFIFKLPFMKKYAAICIGRTILFKNIKENVDPTLVRHEMIHQKQMDKVGVFCFYVIYLKDYLINLIKYKNHWDAYCNIPFEVEAYKNEKNLEYGVDV